MTAIRSSLNTPTWGGTLAKIEAVNVIPLLNMFLNGFLTRWNIIPSSGPIGILRSLSAGEAVTRTLYVARIDMGYYVVVIRYPLALITITILILSEFLCDQQESAGLSGNAWQEHKSYSTEGDNVFHFQFILRGLDKLAAGDLLPPCRRFHFLPCFRSSSHD